ncbi:MAG TPA: CbiX/SirB N-terminal domain-containing protein [Chthoniobacterales bacterium]|nr:CbiX/SirB N-terminal domain-containing protein [Chthoniobacterales bacterium]
MSQVSKESCALILVGHGSTINPDSSSPTFVHANEIRARRIFSEVHSAFWKEEPSLREVLRMVEAPDVYIVPNFISEGYFTAKVIPRELELTGAITIKNRQTLRYCDPVGNDPRMTDLLLHRAAEVAGDAPPHDTSLVIVAHGTGLNENSAVAAKRQVAAIRDRAIYPDVVAAFMEEPPEISEWANLTTRTHVVVVPFFISDGLHSYQDIPVLLGIQSENSAPASQQDVFRHNPYELRNRKLYYAGAIGTDPMMADIILDTVDRFDQQHD